MDTEYANKDGQTSIYIMYNGSMLWSLVTGKLYTHVRDKKAVF